MANFGILLSVKHKVTSLERNAAKKRKFNKIQADDSAGACSADSMSTMQMQKNANARFMFEKSRQKSERGS